MFLSSSSFGLSDFYPRCVDNSVTLGDLQHVFTKTNSHKQAELILSTESCTEFHIRELSGEIRARANTALSWPTLKSFCNSVILFTRNSLWFLVNSRIAIHVLCSQLANFA